MFQPLVIAALLFGQANAAPADCITRQDAADMAVAFLPHLVEAASRRCRDHLPPNAFLAGRSAEWIEQLRREAAPRRASALRTFAKFGGGEMPAPPEGAGADVTFDFVAGLATGAMIQSIDPQGCRDLDSLAESLRPLPAENVGRIVAAAFALASARQADGEDEDQEGETAGSSGGEELARERPAPAICPA